jgi:hypothetical protein
MEICAQTGISPHTKKDIMKKLILILAMGISSLAASAQF